MESSVDDISVSMVLYGLNDVHDALRVGKRDNLMVLQALFKRLIVPIEGEEPNGKG